LQHLPAQLKETTMDPAKRTMLRVVLLADDRAGTTDSVERLMGTKAEARFAFISDKAEFASEDLLDACEGAAIACVAVFQYGFIAQKADLASLSAFFGGFSLTPFSSVCARAATAF
jgi:DNA gyrase B subunit, carboxyl terminus